MRARDFFVQRAALSREAIILAAMIFWARPRFEWRLRTRRLVLGDCTRIVAAVSVTPSGIPAAPGQEAALIKVAVASAVEAYDLGADIVELVTETPRANQSISAEEEQWRLLPVLDGVLLARPDAVVSVSVHHAETALAGAAAGAEIMQDLSGSGWSETMAEVAARTRCGLVLRHTRGRPRHWLAEGAMSSDEIVPEIFGGLCERLMLAEAAGIDAEQIVADPGCSTASSVSQRSAEDVVLLAGIGKLWQLDRPVLWGVRMAAPRWKGRGPEADVVAVSEASLIAGHVAAILAGAHLLRVQDVAAARQAAGIADAVLGKAGE
jgi:dihydropteroate synthase